MFEKNELPCHPRTGAKCLGYTGKGKPIYEVVGAAGTNVNSNDSMVRRLETELREKEVFAAGVVERANTSNRDLSEDEKNLLAETRSRMESIRDQIDQLEEINKVANQVHQRVRVVDAAINRDRRSMNASGSAEVEYASAGAYALDVRSAALGDRMAADRLEVYYRSAQHQTTADNPGVVPDPVVGEVINFIDAARPIVGALGPRPMPSATWHRPKVTQHTTVGKQGTNGLAADEKTELVSQKMTITRLNAQAVTYGGYVNVSRQNIDFSTPSGLDIVVNDLAAQYAIETEAATGDALAAVATSPVTYDPTNATSLAGAIWAAAAKVFTAVKGQGRLLLFISPDRLRYFGPLFAPYGAQNQQGQGFSAVQFGQGAMGVISGVPAMMSAGLGNKEAFLTSTAAIEVYEQRVGTLQVTEPSVMGVQVAYAGYFTPLTIEANGIVPVSSTGS